MEGFKFRKDKKSTKGISKVQKEQNGFVRFFSLYFRKLWILTILNAMYFLFCIPIVTFGPATAAFSKILRNISQERPIFIFSDFWQAFKSNFKHSFLLGIIDVVLMVSLTYAIIFYGSLSIKSPAYLIVLMFVAMIVFTVVMMHFYIYFMMVSANLKLSEIIKNSLILAMSEAKINIITLLSVAGSIFVFVMLYPYSFVIIPFLPLSFIGFIVAFNSYPIIRKYVIQPYYDQKGELNPEFEYLYGSEDETAFKDTVDN